MTETKGMDVALVIAEYKVLRRQAEQAYQSDRWNDCAERLARRLTPVGMMSYEAIGIIRQYALHRIKYWNDPIPMSEWKLAEGNAVRRLAGRPILPLAEFALIPLCGIWVPEKQAIAESYYGTLFNQLVEERRMFPRGGLVIKFKPRSLQPIIGLAEEEEPAEEAPEVAPEAAPAVAPAAAPAVRRSGRVTKKRQFFHDEQF